MMNVMMWLVVRLYVKRDFEMVIFPWGVNCWWWLWWWFLWWF